MTEEVKNEMETLLETVKEEPTHRNYWYAHKKIQKLDLEYDDKNQLKITLFSSHTIDLLKIYLDIDSRMIGLEPDVWVGPFNQYQQTVLDNSSKLYDLDPNLIVFNIHLKSLVTEGFLTNFPRLAREDKEDEMEGIIQNIKSILTTLKERTDAIVLFSNFIVPTSSPYGILENKQEIGYQGFYRLLNEKLIEIYQEDTQIFIVDLDQIAGKFGKSRVTNNSMYYRGTIIFSEEFLPELSREYMGYIKALKNKNRKAIVLDLDNTLWGGIIGEDGIDGIKLNQNYPGKEFYEFQQAIKQLYNRGIILAANSKNNFEDAIEAIRNHPAMVLKEDHFAAMRINWQDKVQNIIEIADELNIGIDSLVFMDDNPVERERVKTSLPDVLVVDMPEDPHDYVDTLKELNDFNTLSLTNEDLKRGEMYVARRKRKSLETTVESMEKFIKSLEITATIRPADEFALPRVTSLVNRTNQFNVTTKRFTENQIKEFYEEDDSLQIYTLRVTDKFGDEGIVGVAMIEKVDNYWNIVNFMMSCRVIGRKIETTFIQKIINDAVSQEIEYIKATYIPTKKNNLVNTLFEDHGFDVINEKEDGSKHYRYEIEGNVEYPDFIEVVTE